MTINEYLSGLAIMFASLVPVLALSAGILRYRSNR
jgi:hypothetical protein